MPYSSPSRASTPGRRSSTPAAPNAPRSRPTAGSIASSRPSHVPENIVASEGSAGCHSATPRCGDSHVRVQPHKRIDAPAFGAGLRVKRDHLAGRRRDDQQIADQHGPCLEPLHRTRGMWPLPTGKLARVRGPPNAQARDVGRSDLGERGEPRRRVDRVRSGWVRLGRVGSGWVGLDQVGSGWARLASAAHTPRAMNGPRMAIPYFALKARSTKRDGIDTTKRPPLGSTRRRNQLRLAGLVHVGDPSRLGVGRARPDVAMQLEHARRRARA